MIEIENFFNVIPDKNQEIIEKLIHGKKFWLERIVSYGQTTPKGECYDQETNEWVILLKGKAKLLFEKNNETIIMEPGDFVFIPAHCKHRVEFTEPDTETIWLAIHFND